MQYRLAGTARQGLPVSYDQLLTSIQPAAPASRNYWLVLMGDRLYALNSIAVRVVLFSGDRRNSVSFLKLCLLL